MTPRCGPTTGWCGRVRPGEPYAPGRDCDRCWLMTHSAPHRANWGVSGPPVQIGFRPPRVRRTPRSGTRTPPPPAAGPGTELKNLLAELGLTPTSGCACESRVAKMNSGGIEWVVANRKEVVGWLREEGKSLSWTEKIKAVILAASSKIVFAISPTDVYGSLVDEAVRRCTSGRTNNAPAAVQDRQVQPLDRG